MKLALLLALAWTVLALGSWAVLSPLLARLVDEQRNAEQNEED